MIQLSPSPNSTTVRYAIPVFLTLIVVGLAGNYFSFSLFLNVDFLFGSIFALLALQFLGLGRGILAAAIIASYTYSLWNHPYAIIIMTAEVGVVGWQMKHKKWGLVLADALYWVIIGMPLVYLFYHIIMHVSLSNTYIAMTKQGVNGIANAVVARLIFTGFTLRSRSSLIPSSEIMSSLFAFFVLCPTLIILAIGSRSDFTETDQRVRSLLVQHSQLMNDYINTWAALKESAIASLAEMAASRSPQQMQSFLEQLKKSNANFLRVGLLDRDATITAYFPLLDDLGQENIGKNFADRPFIPTLKQTLKPMLSEVVMGRIGVPQPMVTMLAPVVIHGEYSGYVTGILSLEQIRKHLDNCMLENAMLYTLVDKNGNVIMANRTDQKVMTPFVHAKGTINHLDARINQWVPVMPSNVSIMERWKNSFYVAETAVGSLAEWKLILEQPVAPFQKTLSDKYTGKLILLFLILLGALVLAEMLSRRAIATLVDLRLITHDLPTRLETGDKGIAWPASGIEEINHLVNNFKEMADSLAARFDDIRQINQSLEERVSDRTAELKASEERYRSILNTSPDDITITDMKGRILMVSPKGITMFGYDREEEGLGRLITDFIAPEDRDRALSNFALKAQGILSGPDEYSGLRADGITFDIEVNSDFIRDTEGKPIRAVFVIRDITARKWAEVALSESEKNHREIFNSTSEAIIIHDAEAGRIIDVNETTLKIYGYSSKEELLVRNIGDLSANISPYTEAEAQCFIKKCLTEGPQVFEWLAKNKSGETFRVEVSLKKSMINRKSKIIAVIRDITNRKKIEAALHESEMRLSAAAKAVRFGVYSYDFGSGQSSYSPEFLALFGLPPDAQLELDADLVPKALHPDDKSGFLARLKAANDPCGSGILEHTFQIIRSDDRVRWLRVTGQTTCSGRQPGDRPLHANGIIQDITEGKMLAEEQKKWEKKRQQLQRAESLKTMAGAIAHHFNNQLGVVMGNLEMAIDDLPGDTKTARILTAAMQGARNAVEISGLMLTYLGQTTGKYTPLALSEACRRSLPLLQAAMPKDMLFTTNLPTPGPIICANETQIQQVLTNLVTNAWEAAGSNPGTIDLIVTMVFPADIPASHRFPVDWLPQDVRYACMEVRDTSGGIADEDIEKLFDPFFSSKFSGRGLGLPVALGIVKAHGGAFTVESEAGRGSIFQVFIPVSAEAVPRQLDKTVPPLVIEWAGRVLLVEDEEFVREMAETMLIGLGYKVVLAKDGVEAVEMFQQQKDEIHVVLTDLSMPRMNGWETLSALRRIRPDIPVVLASGYDEAQVFDDDHFELPQVFLHKPYQKSALRDAIAKAMGGLSLNQDPGGKTTPSTGNSQ